MCESVYACLYVRPYVSIRVGMWLSYIGEALIIGYGEGASNGRTQAHHGKHVDTWVAEGLLDESQKRMLGLATP
eukprot:COSAG05_NODE_13653_length_422_cov_0.671827_1_plen_74_part_00